MSNITTEKRDPPGPAHECPKCKEIACRNIGAEYGGLSGGGDYDKHKCSACGNTAYIELPD